MTLQDLPKVIAMTSESDRTTYTNATIIKHDSANINHSTFQPTKKGGDKNVCGKFAIFLCKKNRFSPKVLILTHMNTSKASK